MVQGRHVHGPQHPVRHVGRPRNLEKMPSRMQSHRRPSRSSDWFGGSHSTNPPPWTTYGDRINPSDREAGRHHSAATILPAGMVSTVSVKGSSGRIQKAETAPTSSTAISMMNGRYQLPVASITMPATTGEAMAAPADPMFMIPDAVPEYRGAMSIGTDHIGPIMSSAKKK